MFGLFEKPVGIHITAKEVILVQQKGKHKVPRLHKVLREAVPEGALTDGVLAKGELLLPILQKMHAAIESADVTVAIPVSKCYTAFFLLPEGVKKRDIGSLLAEKAKPLLPVPLSELSFEYSILKGVREGEQFVFVAGVEKKLLHEYEKLFENAGFKPNFAVDTLALAKAIPVKMSKYPALMFLHAFSDSALMSSVFHGRAFDGISSKTLDTDFVDSYQSFVQQIQEGPEYIVVSGDRKALDGLA